MDMDSKGCVTFGIPCKDSSPKPFIPSRSRINQNLSVAIASDSSKDRVPSDRGSKGMVSVREEDEIEFVSCVDDTDAVKLALIIFLEYYLLGSETHTRVNEHYLELVNNLEEFNKYPWGLVSYKRTTEKLAHGLNNASPRYNLYGCPFAFQAWAFEHIPELANFCVKENKGIYFPRMMKWQSTKVIHECDTLKNSIFEKPNLKVIERLILTKEEKQHKFIRDLLLSHVEDNAKKGGAEGHMKMMESGKRPNVEDNNSKEYGEECHMKSQESIKSSNVKDVHNQSLSAQVEICISMLVIYLKGLPRLRHGWWGATPSTPPCKCHEGTSGEYPSHECHQALYKPILVKCQQASQGRSMDGIAILSTPSHRVP
ncbi:hypothetical protein HHK36_004879 [Tetracentron sinense]|uniref:DUF1985 domain-containing protein n=1 Tax=Tetracentron sinense TaxID=13715 RepID=A0A834ZNC9_TETSI|nr:hypothetical protein HHK36_004879 [Tetracentron sinense]